MGATRYVSRTIRHARGLPDGVGRSRYGLRAAIAEAWITILRQPVRTLLAAVGTVVAIGAFTTTNGLTEGASNAVSASFNELRATTVGFQGPESLTEGDAARLARLHGVTSAGLVWDLYQQQPLPVSVGPAPSRMRSTELSATAVSPAALKALGIRLSSGRFYDAGAGLHHQMVALIGATAASQLGIGSAAGSPAINVNGVVLTITGVVSVTEQQSELLLNVIVPPYVAAVIGGNGARQVVARTAPGAAQLIGRQGPLALDPYNPGAITAEVPPNPSSLRSRVQASLATLLHALSLAGLAIGFLTIAAITVMSVAQRRSEIGLRRAVGYRRADIAALVIFEAAGTGFLGGVIGACIGILATSAISSANHWTPVLSPPLMLAAPLIGVAVGVAAGLYPALHAARIAPMAALRL
jgi:putative ABC transport system permease protein